MKLMMDAAGNPDMMRAMQTAMSGSPADLLNAGRANPKIGEFLQKLWAALEGEPVPVASESRNFSFRDSLENAVSTWTDKAASTFASGLLDTMKVTSPASSELHDATATRAEDLYSKLFTVVKEELEESLRPELLNRIDEIVVFSPLGDNDLTDIASMLLQQTVNRAKTERDLQLTVSLSLIAHGCEMREVRRLLSLGLGPCDELHNGSWKIVSVTPSCEGL